MRDADVAVERQRPLELADPARRAVGEDLDVSEPEMRPVIAGIDGQAPEQLRLGCGEARRALGLTVERDDDVGARRPDDGVDMSRIELDRLVEQILRPNDIFEPALVERGHAAEIKVERVGIGLALGALRLGRDQLAAQLVGDARDDLVLQVEKVAHRLVEPVRPDVVAGRPVDELGVDPHPAGAALDAALENIADVELAPDLPRLDRLALVGEGGVARDDDGVGEPREVGRQALDDAIDEQLVLLAAAEAGEGKHDDRAARRPGTLRRRFERGGPRFRRNADLERIDPQRFGDVLERLDAEVGDGELDPPAHLPIGVLRKRDRPGLGDAFEPRGDVHAVAHQIAVGLLDHVAEVDADAKLNPAIFRHAGVSFDQAVLHFDRAANRVDDAAELRQDAVAGAFDHAPVVNGNAGVDQVASQRPEPRQNAVFVGAREP